MVLTLYKEKHLLYIRRIVVDSLCFTVVVDRVRAGCFDSSDIIEKHN